MPYRWLGPSQDVQDPYGKSAISRVEHNPRIELFLTSWETEYCRVAGWNVMEICLMNGVILFP